MPDSKILQPALPALASLPPVSQSGDLVPPVGAQTPFRTEASSPAAWRQGQTAPRLTLPLETDVVGAQPSPASVETIIKYAVLGARCPGLAQQALRPALGQACEVPCWPGGAWGAALQTRPVGTRSGSGCLCDLPTRQGGAPVADTTSWGPRRVISWLWLWDFLAQGLAAWRLGSNWPSHRTQ